MLAPAAFVFDLKYKEGYFKSTKPLFQNKQGPAVIKGGCHMLQMSDI